MAWFKVDDAFLMSSKVLRVPRSIRSQALGVWLQTGVWSAHEMKDGLVPSHILDEYGCTPEIRAALIDAHLWVEAEKGAIYFHNWSEYQPTRDELETKRAEVSAARSEAGKRGMASRYNKPLTKSNKGLTKPNPEPEPEPVLTSNEVNNYALFEKFWDAWPRKESKKKAEDSFLKAAKKTDPALIVATAQAYAASPYRPDKQFIPHATTWLNQERWNDPLPEAPAGVVRQSAAQKNLSTVAYFAELERSSQNFELEGAAPWEL